MQHRTVDIGGSHSTLQEYVCLCPIAQKVHILSPPTGLGIMPLKIMYLLFLELFSTSAVSKVQDILSEFNNEGCSQEYST